MNFVVITWHFHTSESSHYILRFTFLVVGISIYNKIVLECTNMKPFHNTSLDILLKLFILPSFGTQYLYHPLSDLALNRLNTSIKLLKYNWST